MLKRLSTHLRANVIAYLALFAALGGTGYAARKIGTAQLKRNAVTKPKIAANAVDGTKVQNASLSGGDLGANSVGGAQINEAVLAGVNAAQLAGVPPEAFGSGVVMGRINALINTTLTQFASPAGTSTPITTPSAAQLSYITVPNQVISDFTIVDQDFNPAVPPGDLDIRIIYQGTTIGSCAITPDDFPSVGCSIPSAVIGDVGVNSLHIEVQAEDAATASFFQNDDLLFAYRLTPAP